MKGRIHCSIGICVYNEEKNIAQLLNSLLKQKLKNVYIDEILIIASGSTDKTVDIVKQFIKTHRKISLLREKRRKGKASAVNLFIKNSGNDVLVLLGGDLILSERVIEHLAGKFKNEEVGMTGARPIPVNDMKKGLAGFAAYMLWDLHHRVSLEHPKMGEVVAFRKIFKRIPIISGADEASIEPLIRGQGYKITYVPAAKVYNKAPSTIKDFIQQRRRNYALHLVVRHEQSYEVSTLNAVTILKALFGFLKKNHDLRSLLYIPCVILLEMYSRLLGWWDYKVAKRRHTIWARIDSTKNPASGGIFK